MRALKNDQLPFGLRVVGRRVVPDTEGRTGGFKRNAHDAAKIRDISDAVGAKEEAAATDFLVGFFAGLHRIRSRHSWLRHHATDCRAPWWYTPKAKHNFHGEAPWWVPRWWRESYLNMVQLAECAVPERLVGLIEAGLIAREDVERAYVTVPLRPETEVKFERALKLTAPDEWSVGEVEALLRILADYALWNLPSNFDTILAAANNGTLAELRRQRAIDTSTCIRLVEWGFVDRDLKPVVIQVPTNPDEVLALVAAKEAHDAALADGREGYDWRFDTSAGVIPVYVEAADDTRWTVDTAALDTVRGQWGEEAKVDA